MNTRLNPGYIFFFFFLNICGEAEYFILSIYFILLLFMATFKEV